MEKPLKYTMHAAAAVDDIDFCERIKPSAILQHFQDIATEHATDLGIGYEGMMAKNSFWVLTKVAAEIDKQPLMNEKLRIVTYPRKPTAVEATRDYYIYNSKDEVIIRGSSKWCALDFIARKIRRMSEFFNYSDDYYYSKDAIEGGCSRLSAPETGEELGTFKVKITDLDRNRHMNNAKYGDIALDFEGIDWAERKRIKRFEINFMSEMPFGAEARVIRAGSGDKRTYHGVKTDGKSAFVMTVDWL